MTVANDKCPEGFEPVFTKTWLGTEEGCMHADNVDCGDHCDIKPGHGFSETKYDFQARFDYNETNPNPHYVGFLDSQKKRSALYICRHDIEAIN